MQWSRRAFAFHDRLKINLMKLCESKVDGGGRKKGRHEKDKPQFQRGHSAEQPASGCKRKSPGVKKQAVIKE